MRVLDLFSGIGGVSLGLHWAGMRTVAFCETDRFAAGVLQRHWPGVPVYPDIRHLSAERLRGDGVPRPDLLAGGFPCQDTSLAGRGAGLAGVRSGLWSHVARLVAECRPRWAVAADPARPGLEVGQPGSADPPPGLPAERRGGWPSLPDVCRVDDGLSARVDRRTERIRALGNAAVPANAAMVGRAILAAEG